MVDETKSEDEVKTEAEGEAQTEGKAAEGTAEEKPKKTPWWELRLGEETGKRKAAEEREREANNRTQQLEAALRAAQQKAQAAPEGSKAEARAEVDVDALRRQIRQEEAFRAAQELATAQFTETCNKIAADGKKAFTDWDDSIKRLQSTESLTPDMVLMVAETDNPDAVVHFLGQEENLGEAMRIKGLGPKKQEMAIAKLALSLEGKPKPKRVSSAPDPIKPISGSSKGEVDLEDENTDIRTWMARREKDVSDRAKR